MCNLKIHFVNGTILDIAVPCDVDLHTISDHYIAFNNMFINVSNILYIEKKETENE